MRPAAILLTMETAEQLLARCAETYSKCATYIDGGSQTTLFITGPHPWNRRTVRRFFRTAFQRSGRFLFEYRDQAVGPESEWARAAIWQDTTGVWTWSTIRSAVQKAASLESAVAALAGVSGGTSAFAPCLLLPELAKAPRLPTTSLSLGDENTTEGSRPCCWVSGNDWQGKKERLWLDLESALVVRLEKGTVFDKAQFASQLAGMQASLAAMSADDKHRPMMEKAVAEQSSGIQQEFQTQSSTFWQPRVNVEIPDDAFEFTPPGE
jgi:hypothetical protein